MNRWIAGSLLSLALALSAGAALAQAQAQGQAQRAFSPAERVEARLAYLRTALKITDAQQAQWNAYADSVRKDAAARAEKMQAFREKRAQLRKERAENKAGAERQRPSAIERLDRAQQRHAKATERAAKQLAVIKPLYASLDAEQKKVADEVLVPRHRGGKSHRGHGRHHRFG